MHTHLDELFVWACSIIDQFISISTRLSYFHVKIHSSAVEVEEKKSASVYILVLLCLKTW